MTARRLALAVVLVAAVAAPARALEERWTSTKNANGFALYGLPAPAGVSSAAVTLTFVTPGAGYLKASGALGTISASATIPYADITGAPAAITSLTGDVTATGPGAAAATIANDAVTYAKLQNVAAASRVLCRGSAGGAGDMQECTLGTGLAMTGTVLSATAGAGVVDADYGDITVSSSGAAWTIDTGAVTLPKIVNFITDSFPCRDTASTGALEVCAVSGGIEFTGGPGIQRSALTGAVTASAGSNTTAFGVLAARSVLANATASSAVPAALVAGADGDVLRRASGVLAFGTIPVASVVGAENALTFTSPLTRSTDTISIVTNGIDDTLIRQGAATSIVGNATGSTANVADIPCSADGQFYGRVGGAIVCTSTIAATSAPLTAGQIGFGSPGNLLTGSNRLVFFDSGNGVLAIRAVGGSPSLSLGPGAMTSSIASSNFDVGSTGAASGLVLRATNQIRVNIAANAIGDFATTTAFQRTGKFYWLGESRPAPTGWLNRWYVDLYQDLNSEVTQNGAEPLNEFWWRGHTWSLSGSSGVSTVDQDIHVFEASTINANGGWTGPGSSTVVITGPTTCAACTTGGGVWGLSVKGASSTNSARFYGKVRIDGDAATALRVSTFGAGFVTTDSAGQFGVTAATGFLGDPGGNGIVVRTSAGTTTARTVVGDASITVTNGTGVAGNPSLSRPALTGDITATAGSNATTLTDGVVSNAKLADMATARFKARITAGTGVPEDITGTQATTMLDLFTSSLKGLVPGSGGGTANFLRADGTWSAPPGAGGGEVPLTFSTGLTRASNTITANLSTGVSGGQTVVGGTASGNALTYSSTSNATKGSHIFGTTTGMVYNEATNTWSMGIATPTAGASAHLKKDQNAGTAFYISNASTGAAANANITVGNADNQGNGLLGLYLFGTNFATSGLITAGTGLIAKNTNAGSLIYWTNGTSDHIWATTASLTERMRLTTAGGLRFAAFTGGGMITATAGTGELALATVGTDYPAPGAHYWTDRAESGLSAEVNIGALSSGVMQVTVSGSVATPSTFAATANRIVRGSGTAGGLTDSAGLLYDGTTLTSTSSTTSAEVLHATAATTNHLSPIAIVESSAATGQATIHLRANGGVKGGVRADYLGDMVLFANGGDYFFLTGGDSGSGTERLHITASTGEVAVSPGAGLAVYNVSGANYERVQQYFTSNTFFIESQKAGSGTLRPLTINADAALLTLNGSQVRVAPLAGGGTRVVTTDNSGNLSAVAGPQSATIAGYVSSGISGTFTGYLVAGQNSPVAGAGEIPYTPSASVAYSKAEVTIYIVANSLSCGDAGALVAVYLERNAGGALSGCSTNVVCPQFGVVQMTCDTGSSAANDRYALHFDPSSVDIPATVGFTWMVRFYN